MDSASFDSYIRIRKSYNYKKFPDADNLAVSIDWIFWLIVTEERY